VWDWKYLDVAIAVVGFLVQCGLAYLGLALTHWKRKALFASFVLVGLVFTAFAVIRGIDSAAKVQAQLETIAKNTEQPPSVTVNPTPVVVNPPAPQQAKLQFTLLPLGPNGRITDAASATIVNGVVTVAFTAKNIGAAQANNGQIWIQICDGCKFAAEPEGSDAPPSDPTVRRKRFDRLHKGAYFDSTTLSIVPPAELSSFTIAFKYACEQCAPIDNEHPQKLRVSITP